MKLNFACGRGIWPGFENSDINPELGVPIVDLEQRPYPYPDGSADLVMISHGLFFTHDGTRPVHPNTQAIIREFHRILKLNGWLRIDDNPYRVYDDAHKYEDEGAGYPEELRISRDDFYEMLINVGFDVICDLPPNSTQIPCDDETRQAIVSNHQHHESFAVEAQK